MTRTLLLVGLTVLPTTQATVAPEGAPACPVTKIVQEKPVLDPLSPPDAEHDPFPIGPWFVNNDRTLWAGMGWILDLRVRKWPQKVMWIRPQGTKLEVTGRRLDAEAPPMQARLPCCYPGGFQVSGLSFPTEGCWEISAKAGAHELTFVTRVGPAPPDDK